MIDPVTLVTGASLASFLGGLVSDAAKTGGLKALALVKAEALARAAGHFGLATNHDAEKAVRRAQMAALKYLLKAYAANVPAEDERGTQWPLAFVDAGIAFADHATACCDGGTLALRGDVVGALERSLNTALGGRPTSTLAERATALRRAAEDTVYEELRTHVAGTRDRGRPNTVPKGFRALFYDGLTANEDKEAIAGWYDAFVLFAAKALKEHESAFREIFVVSRLGAIAELSFDTNELAHLATRMIGAVEQTVQANADRLAQMEAVAASRHAENMRAHADTRARIISVHDEIAALRADVARAVGLDARVLEPIFRALGKLGVSLDEMRAQAEQAIAEIVTRAEHAERPSNVGEDITAAIEEARKLLREVRTAEALQVIQDAADREDRALAVARSVVQDRTRRKIVLLVEKAQIQRGTRDYAAALVTLAEIDALGPGDAWALVEIGDIEAIIGTTERALRAYSQALAADRLSGDEIRISVSLNRVGDIRLARNDLAGALSAYEEGLEIGRRLAASDPSHAERARDVSVSLSKVGDIRRARNDLAGALSAYEEGLEIRRRLAASDPSHAERARDVSVNLDRVGDIGLARNDLAGALSAYEEGLEIARRLAASDPSHAERARDVSVSLSRVGDIGLARNDLAGALSAYEEGLEIARRLAASDPSHAERARDVSVSLNRVGDIRLARNDLAGALSAYEEGLEIARRLAASDPSHAERARDVSVSLNRVGDIRLARNDLAGALSAYGEGLEIRRRLAASDPSHAERARDVSVSLNKAGDIRLARNQLVGALSAYEEGLEIRRRLAASDPSHAERARDVSVSLGRIAIVQIALSKFTNACRSLREGREIVAGIAEQAKDRHDLSEDLAWFGEMIERNCI